MAKATTALSHLLALTFLSAPWCAAAAEPRDSVVKVYLQSLETRYSSPWDGGRVEASSGSGFVIAGQRILTNAHVIAGATLVEVRRHGEADRFQAHVLWVSHSPDLALLTVDTPEQPTPSASRAAWSPASSIKAARTAGWSCWRRRSTPRSTQATPAGPCWPPGAWSAWPTRAWAARRAFPT